MSTNYFCYTIPIAYDVPCSALRRSDVENLLGSGELAKQHALTSISRNGWLAYMVEAISERLEIKGLEFLWGGHESDGSAPGDRWLYSFLDEASIERGVFAVDRILALATERPQTFATVFAWSEDAGAIFDALYSASDQFEPFSDPIPEINGEGALYFFTYLKCLRALMRWALGQRLRLMHIRLDY